MNNTEAHEKVGTLISAIRRNHPKAAVTTFSGCEKVSCVNVAREGSVCTACAERELGWYLGTKLAKDIRDTIVKEAQLWHVTKNIINIRFTDKKGNTNGS